MVFALFFCISGAGAVSAADAPVTNFTSNVTHGSAHLAVQFNDASTNNPTSWNWDFGDSGTSTDQNPTHSYTKSGSYNVTLTAANDAGSSTLTQTNYITTATPSVTNNINGGTYTKTQTVTLATNDPNNSMYYTNDTTDPKTSTTKISYNGQITIDKTTTLRYAAQDAAGNWSPLYVVNYVIGNGKATDTKGQSSYQGPKSNTLIWTAGNNGTSFSSPAIGSDGTIYVPSFSTQSLIAYYPNGTQKWQFYMPSTGGFSVTASPVIGADGTIYLGSQNYVLYALNPDGTQKWNFTAPNAIYGQVSIGADGTVYMGCYDRNLYALDSNGNVKWTYRAEGVLNGPPAIGTDGTLYFGCMDGTLYAINPDGTQKWNYTTGGYIGSFTGPTIGADGTIYVGSSDHKLYAITPNGEFKWTLTTNSYISNSVAIANDGTIYLGADDNNVYALDPYGNIKWTYTTGSHIASYGSLCIGSDGTIYFGDNDNKVYALNPNGTLKWNYTTGNLIYSTPAISADGTLYVRSNDGKLYAFKDTAPVTNFTATPVAGVVPLTVQFNDTSKNNPTSWLWDFGDGTTSILQNPIHTYTTAGNYSVNLTSSNDLGNSSLLNYNLIAVHYYPPPATNFTVDKTWGVGSLTAHFTDTSIGDNISSWLWNFGDGSTSTLQNPTHNYTGTGNYTVSLTATNSEGGITLTKNNYVQVVSNIITTYQNIYILMSNKNGTLYADGGPNNTYYFVSGGNNQLHITNNPSTTNGQSTTTSSQSGAFYITTTGGRGFNDDMILLVAVKGPISDDFAVNIVSNGYVWNATGSAPSVYNYVNGVLNETFTKADFIYGPQVLRPASSNMMAIYNGQNTTDPSTAMYLMFIDLKVGDISKSLNAAAINGGAAMVQYTFTGLETQASFDAYSWASGYHLKWSNDASSGYNVQGIPKPVPGFSTDVTNGDAPLTVQFNDQSTGNITGYAWDFNNDGIVDSTVQNPSWTYSKPGTYTVTEIVTGPGGSKTLIKTDLVTVNWTVPVANFTANTTKGASPLTVKFTDTSSNNPTSWLWDFGDGSTSTDENPTHTYSTLGNYTVTLIATNAAGSSTLTQNSYINVFNGTAPSVNSTPDQGSYNQDQKVSLSSDQPDAVIYYTTDGSDPTDSNNTNRVPYSNPIPISNTSVLNFAAVNNGGVWSSRYQKTYVIDKSIPFVTASPLGGLYTTHQTVTLTGGDGDTAAKVYYTTDGTDPKTSGTSNIYTSPISIGSTTTLRYIAVDGASNWSPEYTEMYDLESPVANFTANATKGTSSLTVKFTDTSSNNPTSWLWDFGDGTTSNEENPTHTYMKSGIYNVSLTATNEIGNSILTKNNLITVLLNDVYVSPTGSDTTGDGTNTNPFATIKNSLNLVTDGGTIHLQSGTYKTNFVPITVTKNITFLGENPNTTVINGTGRIFIVSSGVTLNLLNLSLTNATSDTGGAIYCNNSSSILNVTNCNFLGNNANNGAAIYNMGMITLDSCNFAGNTGSSSGAALYNTGKATVNNCIFTNNKVNAYGTVYNTGNLTISSCSFMNNIVSSGGALYNTGNSTVTGCSIVNNSASTGGAIYNSGSASNLTAHFNSFVNNRVTSSGVVYRSAGNVNAEYNWWGSNNSPSTQVYGTVDYTNWLYMTQTVNPIIIPNGSIGTVTVSFNNACNGTNVTSIDPANGHIQDGTIVTFSSVLGTLNPVTAVTANGIASTIFTSTGTQIKPITATTDNQALSTYINGMGTTISVVNVTIAKDGTTNLTATLTSVDGTSLAGKTVNFTINGNSYNVTTDSNGVANLNYTPHDIGVFNITASYAGDSTYGDSIKIGYLTVLLNDAYVSPTGNDASGDGTASNPYATIQNGLNNLISGGTLHIMPGTYVGTGNSGLTITKNVNFIGTSPVNTIINGQTLNTIFTINTGLNVTLANLYFTYCRGANGGAIYSSGNLNVNNCVFNANTATTKGGAIYNTGSLTVNNSTFIFNAATSNHGGAIFNQGTLNINNSIFSGNTANMNGGAIFSQGTMNLHFNSFANNRAATGSTIYCSSGNVNAENNWWGTNNSPKSQIYGTVDYSNWIYMTITINPTTIVNGTTSSVTVNFNNIYNGTDVNTINPISGYIPDGTTVNFSSIFGTFNPVTSTTINGIATTIFTATNIFNGNITATTDSQVVSAIINVIYSAPAANFTADNTNGTAPQTVKFSDLSTGNITNYYWDFGDGITSTDANPTHVYSTPGTYTVTLTVTGPGGSSTETFTNYVTVNLAAPVCNFTVNSTSGIAPESVQFTDKSTGNVTSYAWDFNNDGVIDSTLQNPVWTYSAAGVYSVSETVTGPGGSSTETFTNYINISPDTTTPVVNSNVLNGLYNSKQTVTLKSTDNKDPNPKIYYTTDGSTPTNMSTLYTAPIEISKEGTTVLRFIAVEMAGNISNLGSNIYTIDTTAPTANVNVKTGLYNKTQTVTLTMSEDGNIYYTLNGTTPTTASTKYTGPVSITATTTLKYLAIDLAGNSLPIYTETYTIDKIAPTANNTVKGGLYNTTKTVKLTMDKAGTIYYTLNGTTPTENSSNYTGPITVSSTTTLKYIAIDLAGNKSPVYTETYTIDKKAPTAAANINSGIYNTTKTVKLSVNKAGTIYYTLNGKIPTTSSTKYTGPISIKSTSTLKFFAVDLAGNKSPVYTKTYTIDKTAPKPVKTTPGQNTKNVSLKTLITIKFSENISKGANFSKIYLKNISTGKIAKSTVTSIKGNTVTIKMTVSRLSLNNYQVYIPTSAVKDTAGNNNSKYVLHFKTSKY
jgi:predicted outer membrane repeat protein